MRYFGSVYRPLSEAYSLIVQVTYGCCHNTCAFCSMYKEKHFALRPLEEVLEDFEIGPTDLPEGGTGVSGRRRRPGAQGARSCYAILDTDPGAVPRVRAESPATPLPSSIQHPDGGGAADAAGKGPDHGLHGPGVRQRPGAATRCARATRHRRSSRQARRSARCGMALSVTAITGLGGPELLRRATRWRRPRPSTP